jgi:hypothetical protein
VYVVDYRQDIGSGPNAGATLFSASHLRQCDRREKYGAELAARRWVIEY